MARFGYQLCKAFWVTSSLIQFPNLRAWGAGVGDPHKLYGGSVHHEHRGVVGARFVGQNRLWFLTFKSCAAGPRIMSISGCGCPGPHGGWVGGWVGGLNPHSAHHARSSGTGRGWVGWVGFACTPCTFSSVGHTSLRLKAARSFAGWIGRPVAVWSVPCKTWKAGLS